VTTSPNRTRLGAVALTVAGVLFLLYPATRPYEDESTTEGATAAMSSTAWVAAHLFGIIGFVLLALSLLTLHTVLSRTRAEPLAYAALLTGWIGTGLAVPGQGAEDFGLHAAAVEAAKNPQINMLNVMETSRQSPGPILTSGTGMLLLAVSVVLAAVAIWRSGVLARASGIPLAIGIATFLPQLFAPAPVRIAHGVLLAVGSAWLARELWRTIPPTGWQPQRTAEPTAGRRTPA
jgi:hypothetical protein